MNAKPKRVTNPSDYEAYACKTDVTEALDWFAGQSNPANHYATFIVEARLVRHENVECEYCTSPATWLISKYPAGTEG